MRQQAKFTLVMTGLVMFVIVVLSYMFAGQLLEQLIIETDHRAADVAQQVYAQVKQSLIEAQRQGLHPASYAPEEMRDFVRHTFEINDALRAQLIAARSNPLIYEVSIVDTDGMVLASTDEYHVGTVQPRRASLSQLVGQSFLHQINVLLVPTRRTVKNPQLWEHDYAFSSGGGKPLGEIRVVVDSALLVQEIRSSIRTEGIIVLVILIVSILFVMIASGIFKTPDASPGGQ